jgi:hypothetical protein
VLQDTKGDKIRIKGGPFAGQRGNLLRQESGKWLVSLVYEENEGKEVRVDAKNLTNFSLAARRAWQSMPHRKVGRPVGSRVSDRVSIIFRVDRSLWNDFLAAEHVGLIGDRTAVINDCLRSVLHAARRLHSKAS